MWPQGLAFSRLVTRFKPLRLIAQGVNNELYRWPLGTVWAHQHSNVAPTPEFCEWPGDQTVFALSGRISREDRQSVPRRHQCFHDPVVHEALHHMDRLTGVGRNILQNPVIWEIDR